WPAGSMMWPWMVGEPAPAARASTSSAAVSASARKAIIWVTVRREGSFTDGWAAAGPLEDLTRRKRGMRPVANRWRRVWANGDGGCFVDERCLDCDACRQIAPQTFRDHGGQSSVFAQPPAPTQVQRALMALVACPTASIGTTTHRSARAAVAAFPEIVTED